MESMEVWCNTNNVKIATVGGFRSSGGQCWDLQFPWASKKEMPGSVPAKPHQQQSPGARLPEYPAGGLEKTQQSALTAAPRPLDTRPAAPGRPNALQGHRLPSPAPQGRGRRNVEILFQPPSLKTFWVGVSETRFERGVQKDKQRIFRLQKKVLVVKYGAVLLRGQNH